MDGVVDQHELRHTHRHQQRYAVCHRMRRDAVLMYLPATITLSASITIEDVASSGFEFTISTETSSTETKETSHELSHTWTLK